MMINDTTKICFILHACKLMVSNSTLLKKTVMLHFFLELSAEVVRPKSFLISKILQQKLF